MWYVFDMIENIFDNKTSRPLGMGILLDFEWSQFFQRRCWVSSETTSREQVQVNRHWRSHSVTQRLSHLLRYWGVRLLAWEVVHRSTLNLGTVLTIPLSGELEAAVGLLTAS